MFRSTIPLTALVLAFLLPLGTAVAGEIYRHVDENGNVTYSDEPFSDNSQAMELEPLPEVSLPDSPVRESRNSERENNRGNDGQQGYESVEITQPEHDSAFWRGDGLVVVRFQSQPSLRPGHRFALELDGERTRRSRNTSFTLENMNRGTHEIVIHVVNANGETISSSDVTRFTLHRPSQLN
ncbi:DUF4124 domain-containing protein [Halovibrio salipaludis]|uniref:DUF4124 domain-containing protein n=1 Tax=Halovibrio salipaludis TaxID=2032626 RepID=UPI0013043945|nr:DUF4124 domain-containing protein [Halovibrio salipaludis]